MPSFSVFDLPEATRIALSYARSDRPMWAAAMALDALCGRTVLGVQEPLMAQIRLAWWRDQLKQDERDRERDEGVLDLVSRSWTGNAEPLVTLVDGWEALLAERPVENGACDEFVGGRAVLAEALAVRSGEAAAAGEAKRAGRLWAFADLAFHRGENDVRSWALDRAGEDRRARLALPPVLRPLAVLGGLSRRALERGGGPLLGDRYSPIVAARLGLLGH